MSTTPINGITSTRSTRRLSVYHPNNFNMIHSGMSERIRALSFISSSVSQRGSRLNHPGRSGCFPAANVYPLVSCFEQVIFLGDLHMQDRHKPLARNDKSASESWPDANWRTVLGFDHVFENVNYYTLSPESRETWICTGLIALMFPMTLSTARSARVGEARISSLQFW